jgi:drug/metabolite transporter (DMT)-like permease
MKMDTTAWLMIAACISIETIEQSLYRWASRLTSGPRAWFGAIAPAVVLHAVGIALWMLLLRRMPLGIVLPLMGANYVTILLAGRLVFGERITRRRWIGVGMVATGFILVAMGETP